MLNLENSPQAEPIKAIIIGGGLSGLACAIGLRRSGHQVVVLEKDKTLETGVGGLRLSPNATRIFYDWGLKTQLNQVSHCWRAFGIVKFETGESLLHEEWQPNGKGEIDQDFVQEFRFMTHSACRKLLYDVALELGVNVRLGSAAVACDLNNPRVTVTTASGEILQGDIILGADGPAGFARRQFTTEGSEVLDSFFNVYSTVSPKSAVMHDDAIAEMYAHKEKIWTWFGSDHCAIGFLVDNGANFALHTYFPYDGNDGSWDIDHKTVLKPERWKAAEPRLQSLLESATHVKCIAMKKFSQLDDWVHESGRMALIGEAAHPLLPCSMQGFAMGIEDAASLGKLCSHPQARSRIGNLLWAFQDLRQPRYASVLRKEMDVLAVQMLPPGEEQRKRDELLRSNSGHGGTTRVVNTESHAWGMYHELLGYDAEAEAENWLSQLERLRDSDAGSPVDIRVTQSSIQTTLPASKQNSTPLI